MDADVVPGSVTNWTVTYEDQRRLTRALVGARIRSSSYWLAALAPPALVSGLLWFGLRHMAHGFVSDVIVLVMAATLGVAWSVVQLTMSLWAVRHRVEREFPMGATLQAWSTASGLGVRTVSRLTFYPWSRLTQVELGPVLVRCRQGSSKTLVLPSYLPAGPEELAGSVDLPAQLISPEVRRELSMSTGREPARTSTAGEPVVVDRTLRWRLVRAWVTAQFGILTWLLPVAVGISIPGQLAIGSYGMAIFMAALAVLNPLTWWLIGESRMSGTYPVGATVVGSMGEWLEIQGPWGSVAWHHTWLKQRRMTKRTVTYEMLEAGPGGMPVRPADIDKRFVVIPRAFLDAPTPAASADV